MKHLSLQQAMLGMRIVQTDHGMIIKSPAGSAEYDLKGRRIKVNGYPEYFPGQLRVKDKRTKAKAGGRVEITVREITAYGGGDSVRMRVGRIKPPVDAGVNHVAGIDVAVEDGKKQVAFQAEKFELKNSGTLQLNNAIATAAEFKIRLSDDMREAVNEAATDAIRNALKPGGLLYRHYR